MVCDFRALISPHIQICRSTVGIMSLRFNSDGTFRVLQMADIQDGPNVREDTIRLIEAAIKKTHPDLIVFTGDQIRGYDPAYIDTFLRRRGENPGARVRLVTEIEAKLHGIHRRIAARRDGVDDVGEHLGVGVAGAGDGIHTGEGETANHGILERHNHYLSFAHRRERLCDCCLSFVVMGSVANLIGLPDRSRWLSERSCWLC